jgi:hypothetical protein
VRLLPFLLLVVLSRISYAQDDSASQDTIIWQPAYKLSWADFQGLPDSNSIGGAATASGIGYRVFRTDTGVRVEVYTYFSRKLSWSKRQFATSRSLRHEQGHFDISEVFARRLRKQFSEYKVNIESIGSDLLDLYNLNHREWENIQDQYDIETDHHRNCSKQDEWESIIASWLTE